MELLSVILLQLFADSLSQDSGYSLSRTKIYKLERNQKGLDPEDADLYNHIRDKVKTLKISLLFLTYVLYNDDYKLSFFEKRKLRRQVNQFKHVFTKQDKQEIKYILRPRSSVGSLVTYAKDNGYSYYDIDRAIKLMTIVTEKETRYASTIKHIEQKFIIEKEYME